MIYTLSSWRVKPRPALARRLYLMVGHCTTGRSLSTGRGATAAALAKRASRRRCLRPGYQVHVSFVFSIFTKFHQSRIFLRPTGNCGISVVCVPGRNARGHDVASPCGSLIITISVRIKFFFFSFASRISQCISNCTLLPIDLFHSGNTDIHLSIAAKGARGEELTGVGDDVVVLDRLLEKPVSLTFPNPKKRNLL